MKTELHLILRLSHNTAVYFSICSSSVLSELLIIVCSCVCFVSPVFCSVVFVHSEMFQSRPYGVWHVCSHSKLFLRVLWSPGSVTLQTFWVPVLFCSYDSSASCNANQRFILMRLFKCILI